VKFQLLIEPPAFILSLPAAQIGLNDAHERGRMERPFDEGGVAEGFGQPGRRRVAFEATPMLGQQDERKVGPRGLRRNPLPHSAYVGAAGCFLGQDGQVGAASDRLHQLCQIEADFGMDARVPQDPFGNDRITPARRENERPLAMRNVHRHQARSPNSGPRDPT
jgi:hypothetical protein